MSLFDTLGAGLSGLQSAATGLQTTTHNVTNATTRGYTRRIVQLGARQPTLHRGGIWVGNGSQVTSIDRSADPLALGRLLTTSGHASSASAERSALVSMEGVFEPTSGPSLRAAVDGLFDAFQAATADPSDPATRRGVVAAAQTFATTVNGVGKALSQGISDQNDHVSATLDQVNADLAAVASFNEQLHQAGGASADLLDARDQVTQRLADEIGATVYYERDGSATVRIGGHAAVSGGAARTVSLSGSALKLSVDGGQVDLGKELGGEVGGAIAGRDKLQGWLDGLDQLVTDLGTAVNAQHAAGFTPAGAPGGDLFTLPGSGSASVGVTVDAAVAADPDQLAFASSAAGYAGDGGNLKALIGLESTPVVGGTQTAGAFASSLTSRVGSETSLASSRADAAQAEQSDAEVLYNNLSGVDLDQEAVRLVQYQAAYQAAAKVIQVTDDTLNALMQLR
jgi:flagellar hook-associated protein 1 FlgK